MYERYIAPKTKPYLLKRGQLELSKITEMNNFKGQPREFEKGKGYHHFPKAAWQADEEAKPASFDLFTPSIVPKIKPDPPTGFQLDMDKVK